MNIPGFTAEAALYNGNVRYQATTEAGFYGGLVQPAGPFDRVDDAPRWVNYNRIDVPIVPIGLWCLKSECAIWKPHPPWDCWVWWQSVGVLVGGVCV